MKQKFSVITRYWVCTSCILVLLAGCDRFSAGPAEPKVVRKKITAAAQKTVTVHRVQKAARAAEKPSAAGQQKAIAGGRSAASVPQTSPKFSMAAIPAPYDPAGKIDPFEPLFREKPAVVKRSRRKKRIPRTPLERIDLSQLKLVGIILAPSGNRALVEESSGKGYIIKKGTYIGNNSGKVVQIKRDKVIVEEEFEDVFGKTKTRRRELRLSKPSGEL